MLIKAILDEVFPSRVTIRELKQDRELQRQQLVDNLEEISALTASLREAEDCFGADEPVIDMGTDICCMDEAIERLDENETCIVQFRPWDPEMATRELTRQGYWVRRISHVHDLDFTLLQLSL